MELITHHDIDPDPLVGCDLLDDTLEDVAVQSLVAEDLAYLFTLDVRHLFDFAALPFELCQVVIPLSEG